MIKKNPTFFLNFNKFAPRFVKYNSNESFGVGEVAVAAAACRSSDDDEEGEQQEREDDVVVVHLKEDETCLNGAASISDGFHAVAALAYLLAGNVEEEKKR